ncbi:MAG: phosphomannomutase/phosphoglucomutase [Pseudomonadota bacterium]
MSQDAGHVFDPTILREYDIRGIVGETLGPADALALGRAYAAMVTATGGRRVCLGYDGRLSSPELAQALAEGLGQGGVDVLAIGRGPTPMMYFSVYHLEADGGLQVTGSHNPPSHNGFKLMIGTKPLYGEQIQELGRIAAKASFTDGEGARIDQPLLGAYVDRLVQDFVPGRPLHVVWDAGNGATGEALTAMTARLPGRHTLLFAEIDGRFPNHHPDPTIPENLEDLIRTVRAEGADLGIAFDGDGDRIGVVDDRGRILYGDQIMQILAADVLSRHPGSPILADVKTSQAVFDEIERLGGNPIMGKTGHSLMKVAMVETGAPLAGEMSGHICFADGFYGYDDAMYVAIRLLGILGQSEDTLAQRRDRMVSMINTPELRFDCPDDLKFSVIDRVKNKLAADGAKVNAIDGVRVSTGDGWWLLRASNTQAVLVARAEARDQEGLDRLKKQISEYLREAGVEPPTF